MGTPRRRRLSNVSRTASSTAREPLTSPWCSKVTTAWRLKVELPATVRWRGRRPMEESWRSLGSMTSFTRDEMALKRIRLQETWSWPDWENSGWRTSWGPVVARESSLERWTVVPAWGWTEITPKSKMKELTLRWRIGSLGVDILWLEQSCNSARKTGDLQDQKFYIDLKVTRTVWKM